jgi:ABC-type multidrug transport system fused ATPase/permease subunit
MLQANEMTETVLKEKTGEIEATKFEFNYYDDGPIILKQVSMYISAGQKVGIVGRTGAGKSSFISALFRMRNGQSGELKVHGKAVSQIPLGELRSSISIIPQDPVIFSDTIRNNLGGLQNISITRISKLTFSYFFFKFFHNGRFWCSMI